MPTMKSSASDAASRAPPGSDGRATGAAADEIESVADSIGDYRLRLSVSMSSSSETVIVFEFAW